MKRIGLGAAAAIALAMFAAAPQQAEAAYFSCPANISGNVSGATGCEYSDTLTNDQPPSVVNSDGGFFDHTDWEFIQKDEGASGQGQSGTYDFGSAFSQYDEVMLVFKDGNGTFLVAYTVSTEDGTWITPFDNPPFTDAHGTPKDVSHVSYYGRDPSTAVPEPASLALLGAALVGFGYLARRRKMV